jgi:hypothetical protein
MKTRYGLLSVVVAIGALAGLAILSSCAVVYSAQPGGLAWDGEGFYHGSHMNNEGDEGDGLSTWLNHPAR